MDFRLWLQGSELSCGCFCTLWGLGFRDVYTSADAMAAVLEWLAFLSQPDIEVRPFPCMV